MCGIALLVSSCAEQEQLFDGLNLSANDLLEALRRRGPDTMGRHTICLSSSAFEHYLNKKPVVLNTEMLKPHQSNAQAVLEFLATTLQLRGPMQICQPLKDQYENVLLYNGEVFDGPVVKSDENDAQVLMDLLGKCCSCLCHAECGSMNSCMCLASERDDSNHTSIPQLLSTVRGPWALVFWQAESGILWFGRDVLGRRSLMVHWPSLRDQRLVLSSVSPPFDYGRSPSTAIESDIFDYWEELPCGIYSMNIKAGAHENSAKKAVRHAWKNTVLEEIVSWERSCVEPMSEHLDISLQRAGDDLQVYRADFSVISRLNVKTAYHLQVLAALHESVRRRTLNISNHEKPCLQRAAQCFEAPVAAELSMEAPFAVLFSGGLDSMILAAIADRCVPLNWEVLLGLYLLGPNHIVHTLHFTSDGVPTAVLKIEHV